MSDEHALDTQAVTLRMTERLRDAAQAAAWLEEKAETEPLPLAVLTFKRGLMDAIGEALAKDVLAGLQERRRLVREKADA